MEGTAASEMVILIRISKPSPRGFRGLEMLLGVVVMGEEEAGKK